jgi:hypothetical protein
LNRQDAKSAKGICDFLKLIIRPLDGGGKMCFHITKPLSA